MNKDGGYIMNYMTLLKINMIKYDTFTPIKRAKKTNSIMAGGAG